MENESLLPAITENKIETNDNTQSLMFNEKKLNHVLTLANYLSSATILPEIFRGKNNLGNLIIAFDYADRLNANPLMVMQNMYIIHGKPGIEAKMAIALLNDSGKFTPLRFKYSTNKQECYAFATVTGSRKVLNGVSVTIEMAKKEGWYGKKGSKWPSMPELMLMYRSAMFWIRAYAPHILLGMQSKEELMDTPQLTEQEEKILDVHEANVTVEEIKEEIKEEILDDDPEEPKFDQLVKNYSPKAVNRFLEESAEANEVPVIEVKIGAAGDFENFKKSLTEWIKLKISDLPKGVQASEEFKQMVEAGDNVPELYDKALLKYGVPQSEDNCAYLVKHLKSLVDEEAQSA